MPESRTYSPISKVLHWAIVLLLAAEFLLAWTMPEVRSGDPETIVSFHMSIGLIILALAVVRFCWRLYVQPPPYPASMPDWQSRASLVTHYAMYFLLVLVPFLGWSYASYEGWDILLFGFLPLPLIVTPGSGIGMFLGESHGFFATLLFFMVIFHVAAALYHKFFLRDGVFESMMPRL